MGKLFGQSSILGIDTEVFVGAGAVVIAEPMLDGVISQFAKNFNFQLGTVQADELLKLLIANWAARKQTGVVQAGGKALMIISAHRIAGQLLAGMNLGGNGTVRALTQEQLRNPVLSAFK